MAGGSENAGVAVSARPKQFLIVATDGRLLGSNVSVEGATSTAFAMVGKEPIAIVNSKTALVVARVGAP